ncbi:MAG: hypothetical protein JJE09_04630 [Bacteroidia bacterium]|nr:hypothetical protein [Bacteroidia bacterium]
MVRLILAICLLASHLSFSQSAALSLEVNDNSLPERYNLMKSNSQTFQDYKVIKEFVLDGVWKIVMDSVKKQNASIKETREKILQLEANLKSVELTLSSEREAAEEILHDSTHISLLGIDFKKSTFLTLSTFLFVAFVLIVIFIAGKMKLMTVNMKEKIVIADAAIHEYEDFKRRALEKQTKLSRELQTERNKVEELARA